MIFTQYYLDCLSQASYLIADENTRRAIVVDPRRDIAEYLADAAAHDLTIEAVVNTHFHADFIAGHLELAAKTGAWIGYGQRADADYPIRKLADGERISLGDVSLQIMETPGHTPESISVLVYEHATDEVPYAVLTGDALFIGDVGRPDLLASLGHTAEQLGAMLYDSVQHKLMALPDPVRVFPAHGAGSACGKNLSTERASTIGEQRATNYACAPMTAEQFLAMVTEGQPAAPGYFVHDAVLNRREHALFDVVVGYLREPEAAFLTMPDQIERASRLTVTELRTALAGENPPVVLDVRNPGEVAVGTIDGALHIPLAQLPARLARSPPTGPSSSIARAATAPRSPPACCAAPATPTSPTCSAATSPGRPPTSRSPPDPAQTRGPATPGLARRVRPRRRREPAPVPGRR